LIDQQHSLIRAYFRSWPASGELCAENPGEPVLFNIRISRTV
jgi:hypothetical protein